MGVCKMKILKEATLDLSYINCTVRLCDEDNDCYKDDNCGCDGDCHCDDQCDCDDDCGCVFDHYTCDDIGAASN